MKGSFVSQDYAYNPVKGEKNDGKIFQKFNTTDF